MTQSPPNQWFAQGVLLTLIAVSVPAVAEDSDSSLQAVIDGTVAYTEEGSREAVKALGGRMRLAAGLRACDLEGLARAVAPDSAELLAAYRQYLGHKPDALPYRVEVYAAMRSSTALYAVGYFDAAQFLLEGMRADARSFTCDLWTLSANQLLDQDFESRTQSE